MKTMRVIYIILVFFSFVLFFFLEAWLLDGGFWLCLWFLDGFIDFPWFLSIFHDFHRLFHVVHRFLHDFHRVFHDVHLFPHSFDPLKSTQDGRLGITSTVPTLLLLTLPFLVQFANLQLQVFDGRPHPSLPGPTDEQLEQHRAPCCAPLMAPRVVASKNWMQSPYMS